MAEIGFDSEKIDKYFKGEYSDKDTSYIDEVFCDDNKEADLKHHLLRQFYELLPEDDMDKKDLDHILYKIHYEINTKIANRKGRKFSRFLIWSARIAGIIILPLAIFWGVKGYLSNNSGKETWIEIKAPAWTRAKFTLPDSTVVWLNSKSSIKYRGDYISERTIILDGEAYFNIRTNKSRPFTVNTDDLIIKAIGTKFNVASYNDEKNLEVVLEEGELLINDRKLNISVQMVPDELITYNKEKDNITSEYVQTQAYISWTEGKLVFRNDPIDVIARRLGRWYNVDVDIKGDNFDKLRLRATFVDENLEEVLYFLKLSLPIDYKIIEGGIISDDNYSKKKVEITVK